MSSQNVTWRRRPLAIFNGDSKMDTTVSHYVVFENACLRVAGELLEKVTRVLTPEEQAVMDQDWIGRDGSKRKLDASMRQSLRALILLT